MNRPFTPEEISWHKRWKPSSGHPGGWRVTREDFSDRPEWSGLQEHRGPKGHLILFRSHEAAKRRADRLNAETPTP